MKLGIKIVDEGSVLDFKEHKRSEFSHSKVGRQSRQGLKLIAWNNLLPIVNPLNLSPQWYGVLLFGMAYFIYRSPVLSVVALLATGLSIGLTLCISKLVPLKRRSLWKYVSLIDATVIFSFLTTPSYAFLDGMEATINAIVALAGGSVSPDLGTSVADGFRLFFFVGVLIALVAAWVNRQENDQLKNVAVAFATFLSMYAVAEIAGNLIFGGGTA